jgi:hypothetical protein
MDTFLKDFLVENHPYGPMLFVTYSVTAFGAIAFAFFQTKWGKRFLDGEDYQED